MCLLAAPLVAAAQACEWRQTASSWMPHSLQGDWHPTLRQELLQVLCRRLQPVVKQPTGSQRGRSGGEGAAGCPGPQSPAR